MYIVCGGASAAEYATLHTRIMFTLKFITIVCAYGCNNLAIYMDSIFLLNASCHLFNRKHIRKLHPLFSLIEIS